MISSLVPQSLVQVDVSPHAKSSSGLSRVFAAAVVNRQFCDMLLQDPQTALQKGYLGETFALSREEHDLIISIRAASLSDLAREVNKSLQNQ